MKKNIYRPIEVGSVVRLRPDLQYSNKRSGEVVKMVNEGVVWCWVIWDGEEEAQKVALSWLVPV